MAADYVMSIYYMLLAKRRKVKRNDLALHAGVNVRTVSRCIDALILAGVPIYSETGPNGGYYIPDDYVITKAAFGAEEKARIINCLNAAKPNFDDNLCEVLVNKLQCLSGGEEKYLVKSDTLVIDASGWNSPQHASRKITVLGKAAEERKTVTMRYTDRYEYSSERKFDPYCVVLKSGIWYVYGWCHVRKDFRLFKITRIKDVVVSDSTFEKRPSDVYEKLRGDFSAEEPIRFCIEFDNLTMPDIEEWLGSEAIEDLGRCYRATAEVYGEKQLLDKLLGFGSGVKVIFPQSIINELIADCKRTLAQYS